MAARDNILMVKIQLAFEALGTCLIVLVVQTDFSPPHDTRIRLVDVHERKPVLEWCVGRNSLVLVAIS